MNSGVAVRLSISLTICGENTTDTRIKWDQIVCVYFVAVRIQWCRRLVVQDAEQNIWQSSAYERG